MATNRNNVSKAPATPKFYMSKRGRLGAVGVAFALLVGGVGVSQLNQSDAAVCRNTTIRYGSTGSCVRTIQGVLGLKIDGKYGQSTFTSVRAFQYRNRLPNDGVAGKNTWNRICVLFNGELYSKRSYAPAVGCQINASNKRYY